MAFLEYIVGIICVMVVTGVVYFKWAYGYWKRRKVAYIEPTIPLGNIENPLFMRKGFIGMTLEAYREFKAKGERFGGIYLLYKPIFMPIDANLIKSILTKDFSHFTNHVGGLDEEVDPISTNVFNAEDEKWRNLRTKLTPTFTSGKMKFMFNTITHCCDQMIDHIKSSIARGKPLELKEMTSCYTTDVVGCCVFGVDCNSFKNPDAAFRKYGRKVTEPTFTVMMRQFLQFIMPEVNKVLRMRLIDKEASEFFNNVFQEVFESRKAVDSDRKDFIRLLLDMREGHAKPSEKLTMKEMLAQAITFFLAGTDTSSSNVAFSLYELAMHQDIQDRLRAEILEVLNRHDGELTYEAIMEMNYMDRVIDETLRFFPPLPVITRSCNKDYIVPGTDLTIQKGSSVIISVLGLHMDEEYFPEPEKFDPDRFTKENKAKRPQYVHIPFGEGPRICIGQRFALMQIKIALSMILKNFRMLPHPSTPKSLSYDPKRLAIVPEANLILNAELL